MSELPHDGQPLTADSAARRKALVDALPEIQRHVMCLPTSADKEDILQDVLQVLWQRIDDYDLNRPILPWAMGIARITRKKAERDRQRWRFSPEVEDLIAKEQALDRYTQEKVDMLRDCLQALRDAGNDLTPLEKRHRGLAFPTPAKKSSNKVSSQLTDAADADGHLGDARSNQFTEPIDPSKANGLGSVNAERCKRSRLMLKLLDCMTRKTSEVHVTTPRKP